MHKAHKESLLSLDASPRAASIAQPLAPRRLLLPREKRKRDSASVSSFLSPAGAHLLACVVDERCRRASRRVNEPLLHRVRPPYHHNMSLCGQSVSGGGARSECWVRTCCAGVLIYPSSPTSLRKTSCPVCGHCTSTRNWAEVSSVAWRGTAPRIQPAASAHDACFYFSVSETRRRTRRMHDAAVPGGGGGHRCSWRLHMGGWHPLSASERAQHEHCSHGPTVSTTRNGKQSALNSLQHPLHGRCCAHRRQASDKQDPFLVLIHGGALAALERQAKKSERSRQGPLPVCITATDK